MYKVLFADDEPRALEALTYVIDWKSMGFSICGACTNGRDAVEEIERYHPDLVITDIRMPVMDGLDLIAKVKERQKEIKFIVVSGFSEFEYAKKAMQYEVHHYLLKPILEDELTEALLEIKKQLDGRHWEKENNRIERDAAFSNFLLELLLGEPKNEAADHLREFMEETVIQREWICVLAEFGYTETIGSRWVGGQAEAKRPELDRILEEPADRNKYVYLIPGSINTFVLLVGAPDSGRLEPFLEIMIKKLHDGMISAGISGFSIAVGDKAGSLLSVRHSYETAGKALNHKFYLGLEQTIFYSGIKDRDFSYKLYETSMYRTIPEAVEEANAGKLERRVREMFRHFETQKLAPEFVIMSVVHLIYQINDSSREWKDQSIEWPDENIVFEIENNQRTIHQLKGTFLAYCLKCCEQYKRIRERNTQRNITKIIEYILQNYQRNITVREVAEKFYLHPVYLGQLFIRKFGISFNEYLHKIRIEEAKRLMEETDMKTHQIAEELGYRAYDRFLQQFEKHTRMKPLEYKRRLQLHKITDV